MENALKLIEKHTDISQGTLRQYKSQLRSLYVKGSEYFGMDGVTDIKEKVYEDLFLDRVKEDPENMINIINKNWKGGTAKTYLNVLIVYLRCLIHESQSASVGPTAAPVALSQTLMLYRYQPLRADYASVYYDPGGNKGGNYWTGEDLILNNYKTSKTYGKLVSPVSEFLEEYINKYIDENEIEEGDYFFPDKAESHISNNLLGKRIKNYFKQLGVENPPNLQQLRHIYLMNKYGAIKKEMDNDAFLMGHSKDTQNKYILKFE